MASTTALYSGFTGLNAQSRSLEVIGNNIANVNTTAFKSSRVMFQSLFSRTYSEGSAPADTTGGSNPKQVGLGVAVSAVQRDMGTGTISATGDSRDLAIDGKGFFQVRRNNEDFFTRAGALRTDAANNLVTPNGENVLGFGVDENFNIVQGALVNLNIPVGQLTIAEATRNVNFSGNLDAGGLVPTRGSSTLLRGSPTTGLSLIATANPPPNVGELLNISSRLVDVEDPLLPGSGTPLFNVGQTLELNGAEKGDKVLPTRQLPITDTLTLQDFMNFLTEALGLDASAGANPDGVTPGVALDPATGVITVTSNTGRVNSVTLEADDLRLLSATGQLVRAPLAADQVAAADGESVRTTFIAYDSLGTPVQLDLSFVLDSKSAAGTRWRYFVESPDNVGPIRTLGTGLIDFDTAGRLLTNDPVTVLLDRAGTGAASPLTIDLNFADATEGLTALDGPRSELASTFQDGSSLGTLTSYGTGKDGIITGTFSNGLTRPLGQVTLATFTNPEGLVDLGNNLWRTSANSGNPIVTTPGSFGTGQIVAGSLELSNVDLGQEFINMINTSTAYSASSRVVRTADELFQQLLVIGR